MLLPKVIYLDAEDLKRFMSDERCLREMGWVGAPPDTALLPLIFQAAFSFEFVFLGLVPCSQTLTIAALRCIFPEL